jgi:diacylglycerol kinase family enzyme
MTGGSIIHRIAVLLFALSCVSTSAFSVPLPGGSGMSALPATSSAGSVADPSPQKAAAIILNRNARSVTKDLIPLAQSIFGVDHVFVTSTEQDAREAAAATLNYRLVIPVGGDGTLSSLVNYMCEALALDPSNAMPHLPFMGYIPMGTGNGVGSVVGCRLPKRGLYRSKRRKMRQLKVIMEQLRQVGQDLLFVDIQASNYSIVEMPMMQVLPHSKDECSNNTNTAPLCFFAGVGFDSLMLNDFKTLKAWSERTGVLKRALGSITGYCVALVAMTLPQCVLQNKHQIHVTLTTRRSNKETLWIDHRRGDFAEVVGNDGDGQETLLYQGAAGILAAGTSPFYGGGLRLFPFARMYTDRMHLRLGRIHPLKGFLNIPRIFEGSYRDDDFGCLDFIGDDFEVEVREDSDLRQQGGYPFQHSGESAGHLERFRLKVVQEPVRFISFLPKRVVVTDNS